MRYFIDIKRNLNNTVTGKNKRMDTNLDIHKIEGILYDSFLFGRRNDLIVTNLSFGLPVILLSSFFV